MVTEASVNSSSSPFFEEGVLRVKVVECSVERKEFRRMRESETTGELSR
jgi:hypothetical protein